MHAQRGKLSSFDTLVEHPRRRVLELCRYIGPTGGSTRCATVRSLPSDPHYASCADLWHYALSCVCRHMYVTRRALSTLSRSSAWRFLMASTRERLVRRSCMCSSHIAFPLGIPASPSVRARSSPPCSLQGIIRGRGGLGPIRPVPFHLLAAEEYFGTNNGIRALIARKGQPGSVGGSPALLWRPPRADIPNVPYLA